MSAWRGLGENCAKYLSKGSKVCVIGSVSVKEWESESGKHGASLEVKAEDVEFLTRREQVDPQSGMTVVNDVSGGLPY